MNIIFIGNAKFAAHHLQVLIDHDYNILGVITKPEKLIYKKGNFVNYVQNLALLHNLNIIYAQNFKNIEIENEILRLKPDIIVVVNYGEIIPKSILDIPEFGCINVHGSLLPRWRGAAPIQRSLLAGDKFTGVSIIEMNENLDSGDILAQSSCVIEDYDTTLSLFNKLMRLGSDLLLKVLHQIKNNSLIKRIQDSKFVTYAHKLRKSEAKIDWNLKANFLERSIRAFYPWPISFFLINKERIRVFSAVVKEIKKSNIIAKPGTIVSISEGIDVITGENILSLTKIQPEGGKLMKVKDFLNSRYRKYYPGLLIK